MIRQLIRTSTLLMTLAILSSTAAAQEVCGTWTGEIGPETAGLAITVRFNCDNPELTATLDIPAQGVSAYELSNIVLGDNAIAFRMPGVPGHPAYFGTIRPNRIEGVYTQGVSELTFYLNRETGEGVAPPPASQRPQEPQPPYPYETEEITIHAGDVSLTGTLTYPGLDSQPAPAVLLLSGSGMHDRDQNIAGHKTFHVLADHLTRAGIGVLRLDDRGTGGSTGNKNTSSYEQLAEDAAQALRTLAEHPAINAASLGLIGHSQGASIALITENISDRVSFIIMLAGPATPGISVLDYQARTLLPAQLQQQDPPPADDLMQTEITRQQTMLHQLHNDFHEGDTHQAEELIRTRVEQQVDAGMLNSQQLSPSETEQLIQAQVEALTSQQFRSLLLFDPQPYLAELQVPLLAVYGGLDTQVDAAENAAALDQLINEDQRMQTRIVTLENLNHLLQPADTGLPTEYPLIETTIDGTALALTEDWIRQQTIP